MDFGQANLFQGLKNIPSDVETLLQNNGFICMNQTNFGTQTRKAFGAKTVNNLPLLLEVSTPSNSGDSNGLTVTYKIPVMPLKPLFEDAIKHIFG